MAVTGTTVVQFEVNDLLDHAFRRCRVAAVKITPEMQHVALQSLGMMLLALSNRGVLLWTQEAIVVPLYEGRAEYTLPGGTVDVLSSVNLRTLTRQSGTNQIASAGVPALAFDDDFETVCNAGALGWIGSQYDTPTRVTSISVLGGAAGPIVVVFERSDDAVTWTPIGGPEVYAMSDREWACFDIDGSVAAPYFRVRAVAGTLSAREVFFGSDPMEIPLGRNNRDDWVNFPNKQQMGQPVNFWDDRQRDAPVLHTWPVCSREYRYAQLSIMRQRETYDVGGLRDTLDVPKRWVEAIIWMLAWRVYVELPEEVQPDVAYVTGVLKPSADQAELDVQNEERDDSPIRWQPNISYYTRR